jgi:saccharopine dehydrogenase (NAD+, L-lysine-forming)
MLMKVVIIGGAGSMAKGIIHDLIFNQDISEILLADKNMQKLADYKSHFNDKRVKTEYGDLSDKDDLVKKLRHSDLLINATWYELNLLAMKAALAAKVNYIDLGGLYYTTKKQLELSSDFEKLHLTAVLGAGAAPGITSICARYAYDKLDRVDEIQIRTGGRGAKSIYHSVRTFLDEHLIEPVILEERQFRKLPTFSGEETYYLLEPVGEVTGHFVIHSETATADSFFEKGLKNFTVRVGASEEKVKQAKVLLELGLLKDEKMKIGGLEISPKEFIYSCLSRYPSQDSFEEKKALMVTVLGHSDHKRFRYTLQTAVESKPDKGLTCSAIWTGVPCSIISSMLLDGKIPEKGVYPTEKVVNPELFFHDLEKRNIQITKNVDELK